MLNISNNSVNHLVNRKRFKTLTYVEAKRSGKVVMKVLISFTILGILALFLPWTQSIRSNGALTTLRPDQRPQTINSVIAGRIEKWYVQEGDLVEAGDTILFLSEIKDEYFDPKLLSRVKDQIRAKEQSVEAYMNKVKSLDVQIDALINTGDLKLEQAKNKRAQAKLQRESDSIAYVAAETNFNIAKEQLRRMEELFKDGLKSQTDLEKRRNDFQKADSDRIEARNKLLKSQNELLNARVEINSIRAQYQDEVSKAESEKFAALSAMYEAEALVTKLQNQYMNYTVRQGMYYIKAPQAGYITRTVQFGIGETVKEGDPVVTIMPRDYNLAVEMYVEPIDLPLLKKNQQVQIQFDGWPAVVFSGWPNTSYGTYGGRVYAIDNFISDNGKYRVLVAQDPNDQEWPDALRVGAGTRNLVLLNEVSVWYELWRKVNGFPPDYYKEERPKESTK